jgi:hypothetical protein
MGEVPRIAAKCTLSRRHDGLKLAFGQQVQSSLTWGEFECLYHSLFQQTRASELTLIEWYCVYRRTVGDGWRFRMSERSGVSRPAGAPLDVEFEPVPRRDRRWCARYVSSLGRAAYAAPLNSGWAAYAVSLDAGRAAYAAPLDRSPRHPRVEGPIRGRIAYHLTLPTLGASDRWANTADMSAVPGCFGVS